MSTEIKDIKKGFEFFKLEHSQIRYDDVFVQLNISIESFRELVGNERFEAVFDDCGTKYQLVFKIVDGYYNSFLRQNVRSGCSFLLGEYDKSCVANMKKHILSDSNNFEITGYMHRDLEVKRRLIEKTNLIVYKAVKNQVFQHNKLSVLFEGKLIQLKKIFEIKNFTYYIYEQEGSTNYFSIDNDLDIIKVVNYKTKEEFVKSLNCFVISQKDFDDEEIGKWL